MEFLQQKTDLDKSTIEVSLTMERDVEYNITCQHVNGIQHHVNIFNGLEVTSLRSPE